MEPVAQLEFDQRLVLPNHALFVGASQSGKTRLCLHLLSKPELFHPKPRLIVFCYDLFQPHYLETKEALKEHGIEMKLIQGCSQLDLEKFRQSQGQTILVVDDFSEFTSSDANVARLVTNGRHLGLSVWLIWHSLFSKHAASRVISQNVRWFFFLPSLRLESQLRTFGAQIGMKAMLLEAYAKCLDSEESDYRYLMVDTGPNTPKLMRLRSRIHKLDHQYCFS
jgi:hypothetical protein